VHRIGRIKYLEVFEGFPQGVHARVFLETRVSKEISGGLVPLKYSKGSEVKSLCRRINSSEGTLIHFAEVLKGRN
jgi:hypothetical protein